MTIFLLILTAIQIGLFTLLALLQFRINGLLRIQIKSNQIMSAHNHAIIRAMLGLGDTPSPEERRAIIKFMNQKEKEKEKKP